MREYAYALRAYIPMVQMNVNGCIAHDSQPGNICSAYLRVVYDFGGFNSGFLKNQGAFDKRILNYRKKMIEKASQVISVIN